MNHDTKDINLSNVEVVTVSCVPRGKSQDFDEFDSDFDSCQSNYVSSLNLEYVESITHEVVEVEIPPEPYERNDVDVQKLTAVQTSNAQTDTEIMLNVVGANGVVLQEEEDGSEVCVKEEELPQFTKPMELKDEEEIKVDGNDMLNINLHTESNIPTCDSQQLLENNLLTEIRNTIKVSNVVVAANPFTISPHDSQGLQSGLSSDEIDRKSDAPFQLTEKIIQPASDKYLEHSTKDDQKYVNTIFTCSHCNEVFFTKIGCKVHMRKHKLMEEYQCEICDRVFFSKGNLILHSKSHMLQRTAVNRKDIHKKGELHVDTTHNNKSYTCELCGFKSINKGGFITHVRSHQTTEETGPYECSHCSKTFTMKSNLKRHIREVLNEKRHTCCLCGMRFHQRFVLKRHIKTHTNDVHVNIKCQECGAKFTRRYNYEVHLTKHSGQEPFRCNECNQTFTIKSNLVQHLRSHSGNRSVKCEYCQELFINKTQLFRHRYSNRGSEKDVKCRLERSVLVGPVKCNDCEELFRNKTQLRRHLYSKRGDEKGVKCKIERSVQVGPVKCNDCEENFISKTQLRRHRCLKRAERKRDAKCRLERSVPVEPVKCGDCEEIFPTRKHMYRHRSSKHSRDKDNTMCRICGKIFRTKDHLGMHVRTHTLPLVFKCVTCAKAFTRRGGLERHLAVHSRSRPYKCSDCGKSFASLIRLKKHEKSHRGERSFECGDCGKRFTSKLSVVFHIKGHTEERAFKCPHCTYSCQQIYRLRFHMKTHST